MQGFHSLVRSSRHRAWWWVVVVSTVVLFLSGAVLYLWGTGLSRGGRILRSEAGTIPAVLARGEVGGRTVAAIRLTQRHGARSHPRAIEVWATGRSREEPYVTSSTTRSLGFAADGSLTFHSSDVCPPDATCISTGDSVVALQGRSAHVVHEHGRPSVVPIALDGDVLLISRVLAVGAESIFAECVSPQARRTLCEVRPSTSVARTSDIRPLCFDGNGQVLFVITSGRLRALEPAAEHLVEQWSAEVQGTIGACALSASSDLVGLMARDDSVAGGATTITLFTAQDGVMRLVLRDVALGAGLLSISGTRVVYQDSAGCVRTVSVRSDGSVERTDLRLAPLDFDYENGWVRGYHQIEAVGDLLMTSHGSEWSLEVIADAPGC